MSNISVISNITAHNANRNMALAWNQTEMATRRMASGLRIFSAADDPAGMGIRTKMQAQLWSIDRANRNVQEAINLAQTAEAGADSIQQMIVRMRELVLQAANDTDAQIVDLLSETAQSDRTRIQDEINQLVYEVGAVASRTSFGNRTSLLDGRHARPASDQFGSSFNALASSTAFKKVRKKPVAEIASATATAPASAVTPPPAPTAPLVTIDFNNLNSGASGAGWEYVNGVLRITGDGGNFRIEGDSSGDAVNRRIVVENGIDADVTLYNVNIRTHLGDAMAIGTSTVRLWLEGENTLSANVDQDQIPPAPEFAGGAGISITSGELIIAGNGRLDAIASQQQHYSHAFAGIGGGRTEFFNDFFRGNVIIHSGTVRAIGGNDRDHFIGGAGIGGGHRGSGGTVEIHGGNVYARGGYGAAGVGGGMGIGINMPLLGLSSSGQGGSLLVTGGVLTAHGGDVITRGTFAGLGGAGIGQGAMQSGAGSGGDVTIRGGQVFVYAGAQAAAIGGAGEARTVMSGSYGAGANVTIEGGLLEIRSGWIGGAGDADSGNIDFRNGNLSVHNWDEDHNWGTVRLDGGEHAFRTQVFLYNEETGTRRTFTPNQTFDLSIGGRTFSGIVDSQGSIWAFLPDNWSGREGYMIGEGGRYEGEVYITSPESHNPYNVLIMRPEETTERPPQRPYPSPDYPPLILPDLMRRSGQALHFQVGPHSGHSHWLHIDDLRPEALGLRDANGNVTINVMEGSGYFISRQTKILDRAHDIVLREQSNLGANINRLGFASRDLEELHVNLSEAESRISDADMATEFRRLAWSTIVRHASIAVIAQANQSQQRVMQLLDGLPADNHRDDDSRRTWGM